MTGVGADLLLARAGLRGWDGRSLAALCAVVGAAAGALAFVVSGVWTVALAFAGLAAWLPVAVLRGRAARREHEVALAWPDAVDDLASAVRAGLSLAEALVALGERGPEPLRPAFARFAADTEAGARFHEALDRLQDALGDAQGDRVVEALRIAREVGGGALGALLRNLAAYLREDQRTRAELRARQSFVVNGARLAVASPWLVLAMMSFQPQVVARYATPAGAVVLGVCAGLGVVAYRVTTRIARLPRERRLTR